MKKRISVLMIFIIIIMGIFLIVDERNLTKFTILSKVLSAEALSEKVVRLHVIANSNEEMDQNVKLEVKDAVLKVMTPKLNTASSRSETIQIINKNKQNIQQIAVNTLKKFNISDNVVVQLDETTFPTKFYDDFSLPAGEYLALKVIIGEGEGENWWCVLFPPLCLVEVKEEKEDNKELESDNVEDKNQKYKNIPNEIIQQIAQENNTPDDVGNKEIKKNKVQIRWKTLEYLGLY